MQAQINMISPRFVDPHEGQMCIFNLVVLIYVEMDEGMMNHDECNFF